MPDPSTRRRFQFRLRTLLIGVVVLSVPLAYVAHEWRIVLARKEWVARHRISVQLAPSPPPPPVSLVRRLMGDEPEGHVAIFSAGELSRAKELFPEAEIVWDSQQ